MLCITNLLLHNLDNPQVYHDNTLLHDVLDYTPEGLLRRGSDEPALRRQVKRPTSKTTFPADLASSETADLFMSVIMYRLKPGGRAGRHPARRLFVRHPTTPS